MIVGGGGNESREQLATPLKRRGSQGTGDRGARSRDRGARSEDRGRGTGRQRAVVLNRGTESQEVACGCAIDQNGPVGL